MATDRERTTTMAMVLWLSQNLCKSYKVELKTIYQLIQVPLGHGQLKVCSKFQHFDT